MITPKVQIQINDEWVNVQGASSGYNIKRGGDADIGLADVDTGTLTLNVIDKNNQDAIRNSEWFQPNRPVRVITEKTVVTDEAITVFSPLPEADRGRERFSYSRTTESGDTAFEANYDEWSYQRTAFGSTYLYATAYREEGAEAVASFSIYVDSEAYVERKVYRMFGSVNLGERSDWRWTVDGTLAPLIKLLSPGWHTIEMSGPATDQKTVASVHIGSFAYPVEVGVSLMELKLQTVRQTPIWSGTLADVLESHEYDDAFLTIVGTDAVSSLENTNRYGAVATGGYESFTERIRRLEESSKVPFEVPELDALTEIVNNTGWTRFGTKPTYVVADPINRVGTGMIQFHSRLPAGRSATQPARSYGVQKTLTGLTVGNRYRVRIGARTNLTSWGAIGPRSYAVGIAGKSWGTPVQLNLVNGVTKDFFVEFVATSATHVMQVAAGQQLRLDNSDGKGHFEAVNIDWVNLTDYSQTYALQSIAYESSLASHLTLACDSIGAYWHVDKDNVVQFDRNLNGSEGVFADIPKENEISYTHLDMSFDTSSVVNDLKLVNHGRDASGNADDINYGYTDAASITKWGHRSREIDVSLYNVGPFVGSTARRAAQILKAYSTPYKRPSLLKFRGNDNMDLATGLEINDTVQVVRNNLLYLCRVVGIAHEVKPNTWIVTLELEALGPPTERI